MLYTMFAWQQAALAPLRLAALAGHSFYSHPFQPLASTGYGRAMAAACEIIERSTRHYVKPKFGIDAVAIGGESVPVIESVAARGDFCDLRHFRRAAGPAGPRVLLLAPMSGHHATLLRGTVAALLLDHEVYVTDWRDARTIPADRGGFDLDDYVDHIVALLRLLGAGTHLVAVCQPSVPALAAAALMAAAKDPARPRSLTLMGGPIDTRVNPTKVNDFAHAHPIEWFERTVISEVPYGYAGHGRRVYPGFLQLSGFMSMNMDRHVGAHLRHYQSLIRGDGDSANAHRRFYDDYMSVMDLTAEFYLQTVETVFRQHALPRGAWVSRGRKIEPAAIRDIALMTVEGELDDISAPGQTVAAQDLCSGIASKRRQHLLAAGVGHYGIFNGRRWRETIYPAVRDFIRKQN